ncbi:MAG TPA: thiol:disulfide interchange protein DsbA/DsbL [Steroidobacteraceae bacterium]|nr:thiol:disulfide interchange protein DsbA/DsbL [Steroidobacteraceae bacterium]
MTRAIRISAVLFVAATWGLTACARAAAPADPLAKWQAGTNYIQLPAPQATSVPAGKVEVLEVFWYGCGHCYALDPVLEEWKKKKPAYVEFVRMPVMWGAPHQQHAKLYYTLMALNRLDLHTKVFDTIHKEHNMLASPSETDARAMHLAFCKANGISEQDFNTAYDSMVVATNLQRAQEATMRYSVAGVPLLIVNGKYTTDVSSAGDPPKLLSLVNDLAASEKKR